MKTLVLGATGYLGSVAVERLQSAGHEVVALARHTDAVAAATGVPLVTGDLTDPASLTAAVTDDFDAVLHVATPTGDQEADLAAVAALLAPLRGTGRALLYTSGVWVLGATTGTVAADETTPPNPIPLVGYRPLVESAVLDAAADGVRAVVVRPGVVHGRGGGIPSLLVDQARERGAGTWVGGSHVRWPMVHVDDLADLFVAAVEHAEPGALLHGVAEPGVPAPALAAAAAVAAGVAGPVGGVAVPALAATLGQPFAEALALDQVVDAERTRRALSWEPSRPDAVTDLLVGSYGSAAARDQGAPNRADVVTV